MSASLPQPLGSAESVAALVQLLAMPAAVIARDGALHASNPAWARIAGHGAQHVNDLVEPAHRARMEDLIGRIGTVATAEAELRLAHHRWAALQIQSLGASDGSWLCLVHDIDDLRRNVDELTRRSGLQATLLDASQDCITLLDPQGRLTYMNEAGSRALGVDRAAGVGQHWVDLMPETVRPVARAAVEEAGRGQAARFSGPTGSALGPIEWDNLLTPTLGPDGAVESILCVARNVSQERAAREALTQSQERLAMATMVGGLGIWDFDLASDELYCDDTWHTIMGVDPSDRITTMDGFRPLIHPDDLAHATEVTSTAAHLISTGQDYTNTFRIIRPDGEMRWVRSAACLIQDDAGEPYRAIGFVLDITDSRRGQQALEEANRALEAERVRLAQQTNEDALTGLLNRRALDAELARIARIASDPREPPTWTCVAMINIDHFKAFNDTYGHLEGDAVLAHIARCLSTVARSSDLAARYGGEEFVLVLTETSDPTPVLTRLFRLIEAEAIPHRGSRLGRVTISAGCVILPAGSATDAMSPQSMLRAADTALYQAKEAGRNRFLIAREAPTPTRAG